MPRKLPLGLQDFRKIIENGFVYVDKTQYVFHIASHQGAYFLSRPRRFGKSITISTLLELFSGSRELFKGLWIEGKWDWNRVRPVIKLSLKDVNFEQRGLEEPLAERIAEIGTRNGIDLKATTARDKFRELILALSERGKVVVLVDEYDAPIVHYLGKELSTAYANRELLKGFYSVLKELDTLLELVFLTGVSKFSKTGIFSGLNNLVDLTTHPDYATMLGYTQAELEDNFPEEIAAACTARGLSRDQLLEQMRDWYNGYRFHQSAETVYNPVSVNNFFDRKEFDNFWFATGTPTFLIQILKQQGVFDLQAIGQSTLDFDSFDLEDIRLFGLLYQTGYLTIQSRDEFGQYTLDYPNREVKNSMLAYLFEAFGGVSKGTGVTMAIKLERAFIADDLEQVFRILQEIFAHVPYFLHEKYPEKFFHAAIHLLFTYMGIKVHSEVCTSDGRADSMVETPTHLYILEYKLDKSPQEALAQIRNKRYYRHAWEKGKPVTGIGVQFSSKTKNIEAWEAEEV
ncbi:MAG: AAA family ATPase [Saprospiraceae bacterium]